MIKYIWLSYPLNDKTPVYGGGQGLRIEYDKNIQMGDSCNTMNWNLQNHTGTHVDAPRHFFSEGNTIDAYDPSFWVFEEIIVIEVNLENTSTIIETAQIIPFIKGQPDLVLIKTGMGQYRQNQLYWECNPGLAPELGQELRFRYPGLRAVGVDFISISSLQNRTLGREAHREFLKPVGQPLLLIEDMDLSNINCRMQLGKVFVLPLIVENADGAPCTVLAEVKFND